MNNINLTAIHENEPFWKSPHDIYSNALFYVSPQTHFNGKWWLKLLLFAIPETYSNKGNFVIVPHFEFNQANWFEFHFILLAYIEKATEFAFLPELLYLVFCSIPCELSYDRIADE